MLRFLQALELDRRQHSVSDMLAFRVVEHFDIIEHVLAGFVARIVDAVAYPFPLQKVEGAFDDRVVVAVSTAAHRVNQIVVLEERSPVHTGELGAVLRWTRT